MLAWVQDKNDLNPSKLTLFAEHNLYYIAILLDNTASHLSTLLSAKKVSQDLALELPKKFNNQFCDVVSILYVVVKI